MRKFIDSLNLGQVTLATWIRCAVWLLAMVNQYLASTGKNPFNIPDEAMYLMVSFLVSGISSAWLGWKNNSFTDPAIQADKYMKDLKKL